MLVCVFDASCVYPLHVREVDQGSNYRFYCFASYSRHFLGILFILGQLLMHAVVMFFVDAVVYFFELGAFTTTLFSEWTVFTVALAASIGPFGITFTVGFFAFEKQFGLVATFFYAFILVGLFVVNKPFALGFVLSKVWKCEAFTNTYKKNNKNFVSN